MRVCSVDGCKSKHDARGYCASHYNRWKRYGNPLGKPEPKPSRVCEVENCGRPHRNWGYCNLHAQRYYRHGDPLKTIDVSRKPCKVDACETLARYKGFCVKHFRRINATGDPHGVRPGGRPTIGEHPGWSAVHLRVKNAKGKATSHRCVDCGKQAREWSYSNEDQNELVDSKLGLAYSLDINHYSPRCVKCHRNFDLKKPGEPAGMRFTVRDIGESK